MSHYVEVRAQYRDQAALVDALEEMFGKGKVQVHAAPVPINGWMGRKGEACHIVVPIAAIPNGLGDAGFRRNADGTFSAFVDHTDQPIFSSLPQRYARAATIRQARAAGYAVAEQKAADGTVKLTLSKWGGR